MSIPTNLPVNFSSPTTANFLSSFDRPVAISDNTYEELVSIFERRTSNSLAVQNLVAAVIQGLEEQRVDVNQVVDSLRASSDSEIDTFLALFMNSSRIGTSFLGVSNQTSVNPYIARTILP